MLQRVSLKGLQSKVHEGLICDRCKQDLNRSGEPTFFYIYQNALHTNAYCDGPGIPLEWISKKFLHVAFFSSILHPDGRSSIPERHPLHGYKQSIEQIRCSGYDPGMFFSAVPADPIADGL